MKNTSPTLKIFVVEDNEWYCEMLAHHISRNPEYSVRKFLTATDCLNNLHENPFAVCLDYTLPDKNGAEVLKRIKEYNPDIQVIIISGQEDVGTAIGLLKHGAYDYLVKNDDTKDLLWNTVNHIRQNIKLKEEISELKKEVVKKYDFSNLIIGKSNALLKTFSLIEKAAQEKITVSITGETGTGKELAAKAIHYNSDRKNNPFVAVNVSAIPKELIESELFGHEKGAFTGANTRRIGKFEEANNGTLFLDEIAEMDISLQAKILRAVQEREITRVGGNASVPVNIRLIVATHRDLAEEVTRKNFREDLYYRLLGLPIHLPPLRERSEDILLLSRYFLDLYSKENKKDKISLSPAAQEKLLTHSFPGNIRELKAVVELAAVMCVNNTIEAENIFFKSANTVVVQQEQTLKEHINTIITSYLKKYNNNVVLVAKKLDIGKSTIYRMLQKNEVAELIH